jgi:plastocyanin
MKRFLVLGLAVAVAVAAAAFAIPAFGATKTIKLGDNFFSPKTVSVKRGTAVVWKWTGSAPHNVTVTSGPKKFHSKTQNKGTFKAIPHTPGTYKIVCTIHAGMAMTLKVR